MNTNVIVKQLSDIDQAEQKSFTNSVPSSEDIRKGNVDYSQAILRIDQALKHLRRSIPNGQREGTKIAMAHMMQGMIEMMRALQTSIPDLQEYMDHHITQMPGE